MKRVISTDMYLVLWEIEVQGSAGRPKSVRVPFYFPNHTPSLLWQRPSVAEALKPGEKQGSPKGLLKGRALPPDFCQGVWDRAQQCAFLASLPADSDPWTGSF